MTILPKKKQNKQSSSNDRDDDRDNDHTGERYAYGHLGSGNSPPSGQLSPSHRTWSSRSEDKRTLPDSDLPEHPTIAAPHSKRRNRTIRDREMKMQRNMSKASLISASGSHDRKISENEMNNASSSKALDRVAKEEQHCVNEQENQDASGYNSGDEYQPNHVESEIDWDEKEKLFAWMMQKKGFEIKQMGEDGACLFRAVADQLYGDQDMHSAVRRLCMDYMEKNRDYFSQYVTENFSDYIQRKRSDHIHGNHIEIQAMSELFNRAIQVFDYSNDPINIFQGASENENEPIRLSYHRNTHYNSIVDPYKATIGVGLGLPAFTPGLAEKTLMEKAKRISEQHVLEQAMLEDKMRATDWEATNEAIEEQIARESYMEWLRENEKRSKKKSLATSTVTAAALNVSPSSSSTSPPPPTKCVSPRSSSSATATAMPKSPPHLDRSSPKRSFLKLDDAATQFCDNPATSKSVSEEKAAVDSGFYPSTMQSSLIGYSDWGDDDDLLEQVLAQSQAEYIESLKKRKSTSPTPTTSGTQQGGSNHASSSSANFNDYHHLPGPSKSSK